MRMFLPALVLAEPLVRDLKPGTERRYRVTVEQEAGDRYAYRLRAKIVTPKVPKGAKAEIRLDLRLTDYKATLGGQKVSARLVGGGEMALEANGLPSGLNVAGPQGPIWLPVLALYLPALDEDGDVAVPNTDLSGLTLAGKGTWKRPRLDLDTTLSFKDKALGKLTLGTELDKAGWPKKSEGKLVSADGTYRFTLERA